jgi:polar amino acid transport system ATP-binding protein
MRRLTMLQEVVLARASPAANRSAWQSLAIRLAVMLFGEATSVLDPELVGEVLRVIRELASEGMTMIVVMHEMGFARDVVFMDGGVIVKQGTPHEIMANPQTEWFRSFLGTDRLASRSQCTQL